MQRLSILIASRNTLRFLPLCLRSIRENLSRKDHALLVLDDASTDGSAEWLEGNRGTYGYDLELHRGPERLGIVGAYNHLVKAAQTDAVWMVHTDMYLSGGADAETVRFLTPATICTCTRIEPPLHPSAAHKIVADLGTEPSVFQEAEFLKLAQEKAQPGRFTEGIFAPVMCFREDFLAVGGLDPAFAPQSREDSDLFNRMALAGYRFRQSWSAFCYHFSGRGSRRKDDVDKDSAEWMTSNRKNERNFIRRWRSSVRHDEHLKPIVGLTEPISLVALLGDETENVIPFLAHLEPYVEEIVLVADGPQPESVGRMEEYVDKEQVAGPTLLQREKIKVLERPLAGDFAGQRNFGQTHCRYDWVLHADLDERFDRALLENLQDIILDMKRAGKAICGFPRLNTLEGVMVNDLPREQWTPQGLQKAGRIPPDQMRHLDLQFRLVRREVRWQGAVHETPEAGSPQQVMTWLQAAIRHPKTLARQQRQDARYESIQKGGSLRSAPIRAKLREGAARIMVLATEYPPARGYGLARYASESAEALATLGHEVHVVTCNFCEGRRGYAQNGVRVHDMSEALPIRHFHWVGDAVLNNVRLLDRAAEVADQHGPFDALISHDWLAGHAAKALRGMLDAPWILVMHDTEVGKRANRLSADQAYVAQMEEWCCRHADRLLTTSAFMAKELQAVYKTPAGNIDVVSCGVTPQRFESPTNVADFRGLFAGPDEKLIVYAGRLSPMKGVEDLLAAFEKILRSGIQARLVLAGEGVLRPELEKRCHAAHMADRVFLPGSLGDKVLGALYRAAEVAVLPSRYEPFGLAAIEAASLGVPVVATKVGGLAEIVQRSRGSIHGVPAANPPGLARAILNVLRDPERAGKLAEQAKDHVRRTYSWAEVARVTASAICKAERHRAPREVKVASL